MTDRSNWNEQMITQHRAKGGKNVGPFGDNLLLLHTIGAKSGQPRLNPLAFTRDGDHYVIIASKAGAPTNPDWYYNLKNRPNATIEAGGQTLRVRATEVTGPRRDELYRKQAERFPGFLDYERNTTRVIPVFVLEPVAG
jgi:deazaflavin-dependent oxidoreductase (nitroreductase family)